MKQSQQQPQLNVDLKATTPILNSEVRVYSNQELF